MNLCLFVFFYPFRFLSLHVVGLTCKSWQSGDIDTNASYSAYSPAEVNGTVGLYVGLTSFNVTLKGEPEFQNTTLIDGVNIVEQINYNEIVDFGVRQGKSNEGRQTGRA